MAYVNFKEEREVAKGQLNERKKNNNKLFKEMRNKRNISNKYSADEKYSYKDFCDKMFGNKDAKNIDSFIEIKYINVICTTFKKCTFENIRFVGCTFIGCIFDECNFEGGGVIFDNCTFIKEESTEGMFLNKIENFSTAFQNGSIHGKFKECNLGHVIFENYLIHDTVFEKSNMDSVIIASSELNMVTIKDSNLSGSKTLNTYIVDLDFKDEDMTKFNEKTFFDKMSIRSKSRDEYEGIYMIYETLADKFLDNNLNNNFSEYYYLCKVTQRKTLDFIPKITSYINCLSCGYGERPSHAVFTSIAIILLFSILYLLIGVDIDGELVKYTLNNNITFKEFIMHYNETLNLSIGMFAGVGMGNAEPTPAAYMAVNSEMILGIIMMGIGIGTLTRKLVR